MNKFDELSGMITVFVGTTILIGIVPAIGYISELEGQIVVAGIMYIVGLTLTKAGFETAGW